MAVSGPVARSQAFPTRVFRDLPVRVRGSSLWSWGVIPRSVLVRWGASILVMVHLIVSTVLVLGIWVSRAILLGVRGLVRLLLLT